MHYTNAKLNPRFRLVDGKITPREAARQRVGYWALGPP
jgi:hypothetical protein